MSTTRVTAAEVEEIIEIDSVIVTPAQVDGYCNQAHLLVEQNITDVSMTEAELKTIEQYLAAHFIALKDQRRKAEGVKGVTEDYHPFKPDFGLAVTTYGQQAMVFDRSGALHALNAGKSSRPLFRTLNPVSEV
jgi:hypothetical protein